MAETVTLQRDYPYPPQRVFDAWTDVRLLRQWFGCGPGMLWTGHEWEVRPGGRIRVSLTFDTGPYEVTGEFVVVEPPHRLRYRWNGDQTVDVTIEEHAGGSRLTLVHTGLSQPERDIVTAGWTSAFDQLRLLAPSLA
jgi:uncharacterized protein YndB with AHSA1/START domain